VDQKRPLRSKDKKLTKSQKKAKESGSSTTLSKEEVKDLERHLKRSEKVMKR